MSPARRRIRQALVLVAATTLVACSDDPTPSFEPTPTATAVATTTPTATVAPARTATPSPEPATPSAEPALVLDRPAETDDREVAVSITVEVPPDADGRIDVTVVSLADTMITELVLRWPEALHETLFPAPFVPSTERIRDGGQPLVQPWTKWVVGPGERDEPEGTVSLGYGPLPAGGTLEIPLYVTRRGVEAVAFDLQVLAGEALLSTDGGEPAALRLEVP